MLLVHRAERADRLVEALGELLGEPPDDPMAPEVVAVPTRGIERWISQRLSGRLGAAPDRNDGVCANLDFPFPSRLLGGAVAAASGVDRDADPWLSERAVWPLLAVVDECLAEPWLEVLAIYLGGPGPGDDPDGLRRARRFAAVRHLADLYDRYAVHRPDMLRDWAAGTDSDGAGGTLPRDRRWQPELWRRLRAAIGQPSPAERIAEACRQLQSDPEVAGLPDRFSLFGITRLPTSSVLVLRALAAHRDVHLFLLHPSPVLWERVAAGGVGGPTRRKDDRTATLARNPLLASWGLDAREMQIVLGEGGTDDPIDGVPLEAGPESTLLTRLQADVRADRPPPGEPLPGAPERRCALDPADRSVQVHACHGRARQVEVLRDAILHLLAADPTLEPRDVIVMCPDVEAFAPLVHATFGAAEDSDDPAEAAPPGARAADLRVRLADRALRQTNPLLGVTAELLDLATARLTAAQVLDLAGRDPVRRRFRFDDDDLARLKDWVVATGVRWGLSAEHRAPYKLLLDANTWRAGLDRILVGVAMTDERDRLFGDTLPFDDVDSGDIDLAGRFAEFLARLEVALGSLAGPMTVAGWTEALAGAAEALTDTTGTAAWQAAELGWMLDDLNAEATADEPSTVELALPEVRCLLAERLRGRPTRANFRTGHLTVCTLVPMRSVPHRVVCLLGLDDGVFPRKTTIDGDDLVRADPLVGDRDARSEDRQLLLDALLAATDMLLVTYSARDERTNVERPPAVPLGELLDTIDATVTAGNAPARHHVVVHHPLQPFDVRNFSAGALVPGRRWSFDTVALEGARALAADRHTTPPFLTAPLPPAEAGATAVELEDLVRFVQHPVRAFLRQRLGVMLSDDADEVAGALPVELDALELWGIGQRLLDGRLAGIDAAACVATEMARGTLPPGALAQPVLDRLGANVEALVAEAHRQAGEAGPAEPTSAEVNLLLPDGRRLTGTVPGLWGQTLRTVTYSKVAPSHRLAAWVRLLALAAAFPGEPFAGCTVGRSRDGAQRGARVTVVRTRPPGGAAGEALANLVDLLDRGRRQPLPIYTRTSAAWAESAYHRRGNPSVAAAAQWESTWDRQREDKDPSHLLVLGKQEPFEALLEALPAADEDGPGWAVGEESRLGRYARRLWDPVLATEEVTDR